MDNPQKIEVSSTTTVKHWARNELLDGATQVPSRRVQAYLYGRDEEPVSAEVVARLQTQIQDREAGYANTETQFLVERSGRLHVINTNEIHGWGWNG